MTSLQECTSRAALCRQLAEREPANGVLWMAEAENWSRQSRKKPRGGARTKIGSVILASLRVRPEERIANCVVRESAG